MKILRKVRGELVLKEVDVKSPSAFARAINQPNLVQSTVTTVTTSADFARLIESFKKTVRPFAICVVTTPLEVK